MGKKKEESVGDAGWYKGRKVLVALNRAARKSAARKGYDVFEETKSSPIIKAGIDPKTKKQTYMRENGERFMVFQPLTHPIVAKRS